MRSWQAPLQRFDQAAQLLVEAAQMDPVDQAVIDLQGEVQLLSAVYVDVFAPGDAGDGVVRVQIPLVGQPGHVHPGQAGEIDQVVGLRLGVEKEMLALAFGLRGAAELVKAALAGHKHHAEKLAALLQVGEAGLALVVNAHLPVHDGVEKGLHPVHGLGAEIHQRVVKGQLPLLDAAVEIGHIQREGDAVKGVGDGGEEVIDLPARPGAHVDISDHGVLL